MKRNYNIEDLPDQKIKIGEYFLFLKKESPEDSREKIYLAGKNIIDLSKLNPLLFTFQMKEKEETSKEILDDMEFEDKNSNTVYIVGAITIEHLEQIKYGAPLKLISFSFLFENEALLMLSTLEKIKANDYNSEHFKKLIGE